ncbi:MAG: hypothetical protein M3211_00580, partial [Actinomycetota bacterium]|nr:hypothetical protein [Actinomycetota bacterium]
MTTHATGPVPDEVTGTTVPDAPLVVLARRCRDVLGDDAVITDEAERRTYECDGLAAYTVVPGLVVLAAGTGEIRAVVALCNELDVPFVA